MDARTRAFIRGPRSSCRSTTTRAQQRPPRPAAAPAAPIHAYFVQYVRDSTHAPDARHQMGGASGQAAGRHAARMLGDAQGALRANSGPMTSRGRRRPVPTKRPPIRRTPHAAATQRTAQHSTASRAQHSTAQHSAALRCTAAVARWVAARLLRLANGRSRAPVKGVRQPWSTVHDPPDPWLGSLLALGPRPSLLVHEGPQHGCSRTPLMHVSPCPLA